MLFNTSQYILFLPLVVAIYYLLPGTSRIRNIWLLIVSYYFYMQWNPLYVILLVMCTVITFVTAKHIEKLRRRESWGGGTEVLSCDLHYYKFGYSWIFQVF